METTKTQDANQISLLVEQTFRALEEIKALHSKWFDADNGNCADYLEDAEISVTEPAVDGMFKILCAANVTLAEIEPEFRKLDIGIG